MRSASAIPGASRARTLFVASGVTSRGLSPVPPVVRMRSAWSRSAHCVSLAAIRVLARLAGLVPALNVNVNLGGKMSEPMVALRKRLDDMQKNLRTKVIDVESYDRDVKLEEAELVGAPPREE